MLINPVNYNRLPKLLLLLTGILWLLVSNSYAQYYPDPAPVDPVKEDSLLRQLKKVRKGDERIWLNLDLANIYFNKPLKRRSDLDRALQLARKASELSTQQQNKKSFNDAQLLIAEVLAARKDLPAAEKILDKINDTAKINLLLSLAFNCTVIENDIKGEDWKKALSYARQAKALSIRLRQIEKELIAVRQIATIHSVMGDAGAGKELLDILNRSKQLGYPFLHYIHNALTDHYILNGDPGWRCIIHWRQ